MVRSFKNVPLIDPLSDPKTAAIMGHKFTTQELAALSVADMRDVLFGTNSTNRPDFLLRGTLNRPPDEFWPLFHEFWSMCDDTLRLGDQFLRLLQRNGNARPFMDEDQIAFFKKLPDVVRVYRGCSRARITAMSWTTDEMVAVSFANGHRSIRVPDAVVASAVVAKELIKTVIVDREENEILLDPRQLNNVEVKKWMPE